MTDASSTIKIKMTSLQSRQKDIFLDIRECTGVKYFILKASRQAGKSFLLERLAFAECCYKGDSLHAFVMANQKQLNARFKSMMKWIPSSVIRKANMSAGNMEIELINGSSLMFYTAGNPDSIASNSFDGLFCDEFGLWKAGAWEVIKPCVAAKKNAKVIIVSTPRGKNTFYKSYMMGCDKAEKRYKAYTMSYTDNKYYDEEDVEEARRSFPDGLFRQEYLAEFIDGISSVFGEFAHIQKLTKYADYDPNKTHFFGLDCSSVGTDKTVLTIMNEDGAVVLIYECTSAEYLDKINEVLNVLKEYPDIVGYVEGNSIGIGFYEAMVILGIKATKWTTTQTSKAEMVKALILAINKSEIALPTADLCPTLDEEMCEYLGVRSNNGEYTYRHPVGKHDDYIDSLLMCNNARNKLSASPSVVGEMTILERLTNGLGQTVSSDYLNY